MISLVCLFVAGVTQFAEQPLPGLEIGSRVFPAALATVNTQIADIDEDGTPDLVLPSGVWLQRGGIYPKSLALPLPDRKQCEVVHAETGRLYGYGADRLACYSLFAGKWREEWTAGIATSRNPDINLTPLFNDFDGDGHAELIVPQDDALFVYRVSQSAQKLAELPVFTPIRPRLNSVNNLWISLAQAPVGTVATRDFRIEFETPTLSTREALHVGERRIEYRFITYTPERDPSGGFSCPVSDTWTSAALPDVMTPYRSARDRAIAFAGARVIRSGTARLGDAITEVLLVSRSDLAIQSIRTKAPPAFLALADFDGDGDADLLTQANNLTAGPPREALMRLASARSLRHSFFVHVRDADGRFDPQARESLTITINLGTPAFDDGPRWQAYRQGALSSVSADFSGDGRADLAASTGEGSLAIWINHEGVFQHKPDSILSVADHSTFAHADVDRDGRADLVVLPSPGSADSPAVWFAR